MNSIETVSNMKRIINKHLSNNKGESLAETLVALLISALALTMLAAAISTSSSILKRSENKLNRYYERNEIINTMPASVPESYADTVSTGSAQVTIKGTSSGDPFEISNISASYYENNEFSNKVPVINYKTK